MTAESLTQVPEQLYVSMSRREHWQLGGEPKPEAAAGFEAWHLLPGSFVTHGRMPPLPSVEVFFPTDFLAAMTGSAATREAETLLGSCIGAWKAEVLRACMMAIEGSQAATARCCARSTRSYSREDEHEHEEKAEHGASGSEAISPEARLDRADASEFIYFLSR